MPTYDTEKQQTVTFEKLKRMKVIKVFFFFFFAADPKHKQGFHYSHPNHAAKFRF